MRVLHIDTGLTMRGGQWQVLHLLQGLAQSGIEARLLAPRASELYRAAESVRLDVKPLRPWALRWAARGFDLIHAHDARAHTLALTAGKRFIVSRRVAFAVKPGALSRWKYLRAERFIAVSRFVKEVLIEAGIAAERIDVVYDGVRLPADPEGVPEERTVALALDSTDPGKGRQIVEEASRLSGVPMNFSNRLVRDLPGAAQFVYVTNAEGLGSAALLAMANGVPVIASRTGGLPEIVLDEETGLLTSNAPQAVASAMRRLWEDRPLARQLGARGRHLVERRFTVAHMVASTVQVYEKVQGC